MENKRISSIHRIIKQENCDAILISNAKNVSYLSGFTGEDCWLLCCKKNTYLIGDFRYELQARNELPSNITFILRKASFAKALKPLLLSEKVKKICIEAKDLTVYDDLILKKAFSKKVRFITTTDTVKSLRCIKNDSELKLIKKAVNITKKSLNSLSKYIKPGMTEIGVKRKLEQLLLDNGSQRPAFDIIVASGLNAAMPHAKTTNKKIKNNEPIIIDVGAVYQGYNSDLTRTFFLGKMTQYTQYYKLIKHAQKQAIKHVRPGIVIGKLDEIARSIFAQKNLDSYFGHALGHGVGLEVHELPQVSKANTNKLKKGMVITIEPGLYDPAWGGIRLEDMVVVTEKGFKVL